MTRQSKVAETWTRGSTVFVKVGENSVKSVTAERLWKIFKDKLKLLTDQIFLCRGWFQDVPRRGLASAASAVNRQHYTGCVDNGTTLST